MSLAQQVKAVGERARIVKKHPRFGMIHSPRTRSEKLKHLQILGNVPLEIVPALDERDSRRGENEGKRIDPIASIVLRHKNCPESELIHALCKAVAVKESDSSIWSMLFERIDELLPRISVIDSGIVLKCMLMSASESQQCLDSRIRRLLDKICSRSPGGDKLGQYTLLYTLQGLGRKRVGLDAKSRTRYLHSVLKSIRYSSTSFPVLISMVQAISRILPVASEAVLVPLFAELGTRTQEVSKLELKSWIGLLTSLARLPRTKESLSIFSTFSQGLDDADFSGLSIEQLSGLSHAYSRLGPAVLSGSTAIFVKVGNELKRCGKSDWTPRVFSVTISAFGKAQVLHSDLFDHLERVIAQEVFPELNSLQLEMTKTGISALGLSKKFF